MTSVKLLRVVRMDTECHTTWLRPLNSPDLNPVDYSFWSIMQEKVYQTHIANIDELKHQLVQMWAELDHRHIAAAIRQWQRHLNVCMYHMCESSRGIFWTKFALTLHVDPWSICWIVGLCKIKCLTLLPADFECFLSYYSRFCTFCVWYNFNSFCYHINNVLRICAILCHAQVIYAQNASKIVLKNLNRWRSYVENKSGFFFSGTWCRLAIYFTQTAESTSQWIETQ